MRFSAVPFAFLATSFLFASGATNAASAQPQTYRAVRQALLDGHAVTMTIDSQDSNDCKGMPRGITRLVIPVAVIEDNLFSTEGFSRIRFSEMHSEVTQASGLQDWNDREVVDNYASYALIGPDSGLDYVVVNMAKGVRGQPVTTTVNSANCHFGVGATFSW